MRSFGDGFIPSEHLPDGQDEHCLRNAQCGKDPEHWRSLEAGEVDALVRNGNTCDDWARVLVADPFDPQRVRRCEFHGLVRIGRTGDVSLSYHELSAPAGITDSRIVSCDIGDDAAVHGVRYLAHYVIGDCVMLLNIDEMHTTNHAKFGNGIVKDGEPESVRVWIDVMNEAGGRAVIPFDGMIPADAYIWAKFREDTALQEKLRKITQARFDSRRGFYGTVGDRCVIKNARVIKDVKIGPCCYIKGPNKLKNLTINSTEDEPTQIGEGVEMVNGIVGPGCHVFYGCKAVRFVIGSNTNLKYGARLIHSVLGDNSTVSCCEILNNLIFPAHEQHHNNSFLTASVVLGQSNIAAGVTIGSNHNSRANDGEIQAGRGFWPGLCVTLRHPSRFASYTLLSKGHYSGELDIPLPFSLLRNDTPRDRLLVMPAYWWMYNMYALARNTWKFRTRDRRKVKMQHVEVDFLAPDTAEEIFAALQLLEIWTARAHIRRDAEQAPRPSSGQADTTRDDELADLGRRLLTAEPDDTAGLEVLGENMENSRRKVVIIKVRRAYRAYRQMLHHYAMKNLLAYMREHPDAGSAEMCQALSGPREKCWVNLGGQLVANGDLERLLADISSGRLGDWDEIHQAYDRLWEAYPLARQRHACAVLLELLQADTLTDEAWRGAVDRAVEIQRYCREQTYLTRKKDYDNPFRRITFRNEAEQDAVLGSPEDNSLVQLVREETTTFEKLAEAARQRG